MKKLPVGKVALGFFARVDDEDFPRLSIHRWTPMVRKGQRYAFRNLGRDERGVLGEINSVIRVYLHREVMRVPEELRVRILDGDGLNCQKENLRVVKLSLKLTEKREAKKAILPLVREYLWVNPETGELHPHRGIYVDHRRRPDELIGRYLVKTLNVGPNVSAWHDVETAMRRRDEEDAMRPTVGMKPVDWAAVVREAGAHAPSPTPIEENPLEELL